MIHQWRSDGRTEIIIINYYLYLSSAIIHGQYWLISLLSLVVSHISPPPGPTVVIIGVLAVETQSVIRRPRRISGNIYPCQAWSSTQCIRARLSQAL